ncbi:acyl-CoA thioesterase [Hwanghaeella grinnelliae]|uniref:Acyl-CoA thioesterase n=1 Tax=Hwanghaeella grinnelliae TaxID=2500179 RepID=A0A437QJY5_9PROT|nr:thioesterase family protein [Hwanghaeella grinnelliae]RVU34732.1 acyl-CoA thioesterase [Hwanghaeella grinnelliae]
MSETDVKSEYPSWVVEKLRYNDTDRQGHVNNAVFATMLEAGRVSFLYNPDNPIVEPGGSFVIARLELDFKAEMNWPGIVDVGTRVKKVGSSSCVLEQIIVQNGVVCGHAVTIMVQMDDETRKSKPLSDTMKARLEALKQPE